MQFMQLWLPHAHPVLCQGGPVREARGPKEAESGLGESSWPSEGKSGGASSEDPGFCGSQQCPACRKGIATLAEVVSDLYESHWK